MSAPPAWLAALALARLLESAAGGQVVAPTRRALGVEHPRLFNPVLDFDARCRRTSNGGRSMRWSATLGTTIADAGSRAAFRRVDHDYPLAVARLARRHGACTYALNSAMGANPRSSIFYNRVKGELEEALGALDYPSLVLVRPGLIDGERERPRAGEGRALAVASRALRRLLPKKWRPSRAERIADALVDAVIPSPGRNVVEADRLA